MLSVALSGCLFDHVPTQAHPVCSWDSSPPAQSQQLCRDTFRTLSRVLQASLRGDSRTVRRLVTNPRVANSIMAYAAKLHAQGHPAMHVVPSFTMSVQKPGEYGAGIYLLGKTDQGGITSPNTVYLRYRGSTLHIIDDQPAQDW